MRCVLALLLVCAALGCVAETGAPRQVAPVAPSLLEPGREVREEPAREPVEDPGERVVREELATGADPEEAALQLAASLAGRERHHDALAAVEAALQRRPTDGRLRLARAGLMRDLGMRAEAARSLEQLRDEVGIAALHPGVLVELAELQWLEGRPEDAADTLRQVLQVHASDPWVVAREAELAALRGEVDTELRPRTIKVRDLLGNLRGAPDAAVRRAALGRLMALGGEVAVRAVAAGVVDPDPSVRVLALQGATLDVDAMLDLAGAMLRDPAPEVRMAAAGRLGALGVPAVVPVLLAALEPEQDEDVFTAVVAALRRLHPSGPPSDPAGYGSSARRRDTAAAWIKHCNR